MQREEIAELLHSLYPLYMFMAGPVLFIAVVGLFFTEWPGDEPDGDVIPELERDIRYLEMELDFVRNMHGI